jgi:hypothetical protein
MKFYGLLNLDVTFHTFPFGYYSTLLTREGHVCMALLGTLKF